MCGEVMASPAKPQTALRCPAQSLMTTRSLQSALINGTAQHSVSEDLGLSDLSQCKSKLLLVELPGLSAFSTNLHCTVAPGSRVERIMKFTCVLTPEGRDCGL